MVNRNTRVLSAAAFWALACPVAFAQSYAPYEPVPAYPPEVYQAQDADGRYPPPPGYQDRAYPDQAYRAPAPRPAYGPPPTPRQSSGQAYYGQPQDRDGGYAQGARREVYDRRERSQRVETTYRFLSWSGKVEESRSDSRGYAYSYSSSHGYAGPGCPGAQPGERVLNCQYVPFAPPEPRREAESDVLTNLYIDGGVGPDVIAGGGGGGGGPSNGQVTLGTGFSGVSAPTFNGGGSGGGSGNGSGSGSGSGSSSSSSSASASASASLSANITLAGGFFVHGGGGHKGGGGHSSGCGCGSGGGAMTGWGGGGGHKK
jgi:hypothetical protein